jgi:hypothetical protein
MRKLLLGAATAAIVALQPSVALAQRVPSNFIKEPTAATNPTTTNFPTVQILQTIPVTPSNDGLPSGVTGTARCLVGTPTGVAQGDFTPIRFVGNVLCIDPGSDGQFKSFVQNCPAGTEPVVQGVKLIKTEPLVPKCPDVYPGGTFVQTPSTTGIRTWWTLKHTSCETTFRLEVEFACVGPDPVTGVRVVRQVRLNVYTFKVVITPDTLSWVVQALHNEPLGVCELPCITDEGLFDLLVRQADAIATEAAAGPSRILQLNTALDVMEATIVARCLFVLSAWQVSGSGDTLQVIPCALFPGGGPWGNFTIGDFGFGIVDTLENPCCCKLISDIYWLKLALIGNDP